MDAKKLPELMDFKNYRFVVCFVILRFLTSTIPTSQKEGSKK